VGNGGSDDVSVVAKRVGLKRRDDACGVGVNDSKKKKAHAGGALLCAAR